jgi:hypothetical protein
MNILGLIRLSGILKGDNPLQIPETILEYINGYLQEKGYPPYYLAKLEDTSAYAKDRSGLFNTTYRLYPTPRVEVFKGLITFYLQHYQPYQMDIEDNDYQPGENTEIVIPYKVW